jgi:transcriptional regulator with XRE-family HTH domain
MVIGNRLKELRESKELSQGDIEKRTGLLRCYISRVENGHTVPAVSTLEKMARALEVPLYRLFHDGEAPASLRKMKPPKDDEFGSTGEDAVYLSKTVQTSCENETQRPAILAAHGAKSGKRLARTAYRFPQGCAGSSFCFRFGKPLKLYGASAVPHPTNDAANP